MAIFGALTALLKADNSNFKKGFKEARDDMDKTGEHAKGFFAKLSAMGGKKAFKKSFFGESMELAAGGGAVAGVAMAARMAEEGTKAFADFADAMRDGEKSGQELAADFVRSIPIFGNLVKTVDNIKEAFTGEEAAAKKAQAAIDAQNQMIRRSVDHVGELRAETAKLVAELKADAGQHQWKAFLAGITDPLDQKIAQIKHDREEALADMRKKANDDMHQGRIDDIKGRLAKWGLPGDPYYSQQTGSDEVLRNLELHELARLQEDKKRILAAATEEYIAINKEADMEIAKARREAFEDNSKKEMEKVRKLADYQLDQQIHGLEDQKDKLQEIISEGKTKAYAGPVTTRDTRFRGSVNLGPTIDNPQAKAAAEAVVQLKQINIQLKTLNEKKRANSEPLDFPR